MTKLHQRSSHFQVIDANFTKRMNKQIIKSNQKTMQGVLYVQIVLFKLLDALMIQRL